MESVPNNSRGAIVLCGGGSTRMGRDKAWLPFGDETMLGRVVRALSEAVPVENIAIVARMDQPLPQLPENARVIRDEAPDQGPLPAIIAGLYELRKRDVAAAFVTACDAPLLKPAVVDWLFSRLTSRGESAEPRCEAVVPADPNRLYPLAGVYTSMCCAGLIAAMEFNAAANERNSVQAALRAGFVNLRQIPIDELQLLDPELNCLRNCNTPEEYRQALERSM